MTIIHPTEGLALVDYLALEAEMVKTVSEPTFFTWVVAPTVIYGRHQNRELEVNESYCAEHNVRVVQRQSGGGCVYADEGNLMVSYISPSTHSQEVFDEFLQLLAGALRRLGYEAVTTAHNDILVGERKVAGTACYTTPTGTVVHASMLYDINLDALQQAITPSAAKLEKHAVQSVRQRVRNLRDIKNYGEPAAFRQALENAMTNKLIIFDLDGTLLNTIDDLGYACNHALEACGYPLHAIGEYPRLVGNGVNKLIERALPADRRTEEEVARMRTHFIPYYNAHNCDYTRPYDGIPELLAQLKADGCRLAVASNKYQAATEKIVAHFFPGVFDVVLGEREGVPRKPNPQIVYDICSALNIPLCDCSQLSTLNTQLIYIGDSLVDYATARNAQVSFVACSWGFVTREDLVQAGVTHIIDRPDQLIKNH